MRVGKGKVVYGRLIATLTAFFVGSGVATAASPGDLEIGEAELVVSSVRGRLGQTTRELAIKDDVFSEEVIETEDDAAARIVFLDGTELSMGPSSRMVLDRYVYDPNTGAGEMAMRMVTGVFEFASGEIPSANYDLGTPFGNLAVRGTRCEFSLDAGRLVVQCKGENPEEGVSFQGQDVRAGGACLSILPPGQGGARFLDADECETELEPARQMLALLGRLEVEPAAAPREEVQIPQGPGADDNDPPATGGTGLSPQ